MKMACQWKDEYVIYRLGGPYGINLRQRAAFSSPKSEFFTLRIFPQPVNSLPLQSLFFSSWVGVFYNFVIWLVLGILAILSHPHPPLILWKRRKKSLSVLSKKTMNTKIGTRNKKKKNQKSFMNGILFALS